jgi:hypothetical protein
MTTPENELISLFREAKGTSEFDFILTLLNYKQIASSELNSNLVEWFESIEFYKELYANTTGKNRTRVGTLLYSIFFENSDFYNIIGSLCRIKLGYKGSSNLFWKTKKYERLLGVNEKKDFLLELLEDATKPVIVTFFEENHVKEVRNTFVHSAYALHENTYVLFDSDPVLIGGVLVSDFNVEAYLYPKIDAVIRFFDCFKGLYRNHFSSYNANKVVRGKFPNLTDITILGSEKGLGGFRIRDAVQFHGKYHDTGIWYDETYKFWAGHNIVMYFDNLETIEVREGIQRHVNKDDIRKSDAEFENLISKIRDRKIPQELVAATQLLVKFGEAREAKMDAETNQFKKRSFLKIILPFYRQAVETGQDLIDTTELKKKVRELEDRIEATGT